MSPLSSTILLSRAIDGFRIERTAGRTSLNTIKIDQWVFDRLRQYLEDDPPLCEITAERIQRFYAWLQTEYVPSRMNGDRQPLSPSSIEKAWSTLRKFYEWVEREGYGERADSAIRRPKYRSREIQPFSEAEVKALLKCCATTRIARTQERKAFAMRRATAHRDEAIVQVLVDTGVRVSECARLKVGNINLDNGAVFVDAFGTGQKTKSRIVYLGTHSIKAVFRHIADLEDTEKDALVFLSRQGQPMDKDSIRKMLVELGERAGVPNVHPHRFRHTFAIEYLRNGGDPFTLKHLLGHSTLDMVQRYLSIAGRDIRAAHRRASPADNWRL